MSARLPNHAARELAYWAAAAGWRWERLGSGHLRFVHPNAKRSVLMSASSSDWRADRNARQQMKRALAEGAQS